MLNSNPNDCITEQAISWEAPSPDLELSDREVHLWLHRLDQPEGSILELAELAATLAPDEKARAARFHFDIDCRRFMAARGMLRVLLGRYLHLDPKQIPLGQEIHGKPILGKPYQGYLNFNLSHSGPLTLFALTRHGAIGVDLEQIRPLYDLETMAELIFTPLEKEVWKAVAPDVRLKAFFQGWVRKEAYGKAIGLGLGIKLDQIEISLGSGQPGQWLQVAGQAGEYSRWSMVNFIPAPEHVGALAVEGQDWRLRCWRCP